MNMHYIVGLSILAAASLSTGQALSAPLADLAAGQTGRIEFNSITPPHRNAYARLNLDHTPSVTIHADLIMPKGMPAGTKVPAVILSHGSGGVESNLYDVWARELGAAGYAVFIPDSYKPRGVTETNSNQEAVPYPAHIADTLNALRLLATHPGIDAAHIYNMGFSRGGTSAFDSAWPSWQRPVDTAGAKFAGHIAWYPGGCDVRYRTDDRELPTAPIFVLLADRDNEEAQDVAVCRRYFDELASKGVQISYKEYKGARHGFDGLNFSYRVNRFTSSSKQCDMEIYMTLERRGDGVMGSNGYDFKRKTAIVTENDFTKALNACGQNGNVAGTRGGGNAREIQAESVKDAMSILERLR